MNYLLDTHTLIWAITEKKKLSQLAQQTITDTDNMIFVSVISFWEVSLKFSIGKLNIQGTVPEALPKLSLETGFKILPLLPEESSSYHNLPITNHKDPFDRMLIWQAIQKDLILITKDDSLPQYHTAGLKTLW